MGKDNITQLREMFYLADSLVTLADYNGDCYLVGLTREYRSSIEKKLKTAVWDNWRHKNLKQKAYVSVDGTNERLSAMDSKRIKKISFNRLDEVR